MRKPLIAANWKMFKTTSEARATAAGLRKNLEAVVDREFVICPPATSLGAVAEALKGSPLSWGGQNVHWEAQGAFTGELSAAMLADCGCRYAIVGHSERRQYFGETDETVNKRMHAALKGALVPIVCIGETLKEREANQTFEVLDRQILQGLQGLSASSTIVIAYEPVWAIGTGKTATPAQAQEAHAYIRQKFGRLYGDSVAKTVRILYGGSVKPDNMGALMSQPDIDGGLVGGASLEVESFTKICLYSAPAATAARP